MKPLRLKFARRPIRAARDRAGVPHVTADSWEDALYGLGYVQSLDRRTQILFARVIGTGRAAELLADKQLLVDSDRFFRRAGLYRGLDDAVAALDDDTRRQLQSYCDGVNDGFKQAGPSLPMRAARYRPEPWDIKAVLLTGNLLAYAGLALGQQRAERLILELILSGVAPERLRELYAPHLDQVDFNLLRQIKTRVRMSEEVLAQLPELPRLAGSNAWAVAPSRSATGAALLASDPHLEIDHLPATWYEAVLRWQDQYVMGATLPGMPLISIGRNQGLAWGTTYAMGDVCDFFVEDCRMQGTRCQYRRGQPDGHRHDNDDWLDFEIRREVIKHKKGPDEELTFLFNPLGDLESDPGEISQSGYHLLSAWTGQNPASAQSVAMWLRLPHCPDAASAMQLVRACPQPPLVWIFADRAGHIGRQVSGWYPRRRPGTSGLAPVPAWDPANHWQGWIPPESLPAVYDPPEGFVAAANQDINPVGGPVLTTLPAADYRFRRIAERLAELPQATIRDQQLLQYDTVSLQARDLLAVFGPHLDEHTKRRLDGWDFRFDPKSREATLFWRLYRYVMLEVIGGGSEDQGDQGGIGGRRLMYLSTQTIFNLLMVLGVDRLLKQPESDWWRSRNVGDCIRRASLRAAAERDQPWRKINRVTFENRFLPGFLARPLRLHIGPLPLAGCHASPFQGHLRSGVRTSAFGPSYHFVTDLGTDDSWTNLPGGVSENRFSGRYLSDLKRWLKGDYKRLTL